MNTVRILSGSYRNQSVSNKVFTLVKGLQTGKKGSYITVKNEGHFPDFNIDEVKIKVDGADSVEFVDGVLDLLPEQTPAQIVEVETDDQIMDRMRERFSIMDDMAKATVSGKIKAMIVSGPPGVGKSFSVEQIIDKSRMFDELAGRPNRCEIIKGSTTALGLYLTLYKYSDANCVLVFDDCDVFSDLKILDLLKGALDTGKNRRISWLGESHALRREGVPDQFNFHGSVIFLTNISFGASRSKTLKVHLDALESRCHVVDLKIESARDKVLRIKQVVKDGMLDEYDLTEESKDEILAFVTDNQTKMRELSLRSIVKIAQLVAAFPTDWKKFACTSMLKQA